MRAVTKRTEKIRSQILRDVIRHPNDIASHISDIFGISRQAANNHLKTLVDTGWLVAHGTTRNRTYTLGIKRENSVSVSLKGNVSESDIFFTHFAAIAEGLSKNVGDIVFYGFTEMVNNAIDHSQGTSCYIHMLRNQDEIKISILDNGEGIFRRIKRLKDLPDEKQAILELAKGKLTTDPKNHSGQGIFFTSRMFDKFAISSGELYFSHNHESELDVLMDSDATGEMDYGTYVSMSISLNSTRTDTEVFEKFTAGEDNDFAFNKTIIPVALAKFGNEQLVSRSQAKRLLTRIEHFQFVYFDFAGIDSIGQAFADEIFRVYKLRHPEISLSYSNANQDVTNMITRAIAS
ncbi:DUF4325 domain-containing protein [Shewanella sp. MM_2022_3]|uniref:STAS-like domain-containing protein n=1 Tax=Shewanella sp. MM_2022_3 TaxID=2923280 RepID=UPI001F4C3E8B|nr:DUF4325 domain-containing protein [Shewanella sp. MM_2022_3]MCH7421054.1 DUF4325 domain-containing protein [Shewanella sp. MM_2022_3]